MKERQGQRITTLNEMVHPNPNPDPHPKSGLLLGLGLGLLRVTYFEVLIFVECACENGRNVIQLGVDGLLKFEKTKRKIKTLRQKTGIK